jgi:hypothetical protein
MTWWSATCSTPSCSPALGDLELDDATVVDTVGRHGQALTDAVVARLHASASGTVVHLHDPLGWWPGHGQPFTIDEALRRADRDPEPVHVLAGALGPTGCDPARR